MNNVNIYDSAFPVESTFDNIFGPFIDPAYYDIIRLFLVIALTIFAIKVIKLIFTRN